MDVGFMIRFIVFVSHIFFYLLYHIECLGTYNDRLVKLMRDTELFSRNNHFSEIEIQFKGK